MKPYLIPFATIILFLICTKITAQENCIHLDGTNDFISLPSQNLTGNTQLTIEAWVFIDNISLSSHEIYRQNGSGIPAAFLLAFKNSGGMFSFGVSTTNGYMELNTPITIANYIGSWHHVAGVYNGSVMTSYIDGVAIGTLAHSGTLSMNSPTTHRIGTSVSAEWFDGKIDEVRLWTMARTISSINNNMNCALTGPLTGLVAVYNLNETTGLVAADSSGNGFDGTLANGPLWENSTALSNNTTDVQTACNSYTWIDGNTYTTSNNTATDTLTNIGGCDSVVTLNLTINNSSTFTDTQVACDSLTWIDGITYFFNNNTAMFTMPNAAGCDSVITLDLTINNSSAFTDTQVACDSLTWIDGITYFFSNNTAMFTIPNVAGCDSVITLDLTINNSSAFTDTQVACDSLTWIDGNIYTANNNTATAFLTNAVGCDSIVTLDLTINNSTNGVDTVFTCGSHFWIDGNIYTSSNTMATHTLTNANGCDSIVTLNLTVGSASTGIDVVFACGSYLWIDGNTYTSNNNTAIYTILNGNINGCDSLVTLNLTMNSNNINITTILSNDSIWSNALGATYQWLDCNNNHAVLVGETNALFVATSNGDYAVQVTQNGCIDTSDCVNIMTIGIDENNFRNKLQIYPNPTDGNFSIDLGQHYQTVTVSITDVIGKIIQVSTYNKSQLLKLNLEEPAGVYFLNIQSANNNAVIRLIKK